MVYINTTGKHNEVWLDKPYATITVECPDCPSTEDAYNSGWADGSEDGYHKGYQSGSTDGWSDGYPSGYTDGYGSGYTDAWQPAYDSGYTDGLEACSGETIHNQYKYCNIGTGRTDDLKLKFTGNCYTFEDNPQVNITYDSGYTGLERVGVFMYFYPTEALQEGFNSGYTAGLNACSGGSCEGIWEAGYDSGFTDGVNSVECSGYTQEDLDAAFASGYSAGLRDCSGYTPESGTSMLDLIYETTEPNQTIRLFHGEAANHNGFFYTFYSGITKMVIDGVEVTKSEENIYKSYPRSADWYFYTFPTAGRHNVKFYVDRSFSAQTDTGWMFPAYELRDQLFGAYSLILPEFPLVEAHIGEGYETIRGGVFQGNTNVTAVTLPSTMVSLYAYPFEYSGIHSIEIPDSVSAITTFQTSGTFNNCASLTSATFGTGITQIGNNTFSACTALTEITFNGVTPPTLLNANSLLTYGTDTFPIYVPTSAVSAYQNEPSWADYASRVQAKP